jgi:hypothetical protein
MELIMVPDDDYLTRQPHSISGQNTLIAIRRQHHLTYRQPDERKPSNDE